MDIHKLTALGAGRLLSRLGGVLVQTQNRRLAAGSGVQKSVHKNKN